MVDDVNQLGEKWANILGLVTNSPLVSARRVREGFTNLFGICSQAPLEIVVFSCHMVFRWGSSIQFIR
jgi:hypothetical protein